MPTYLLTVMMTNYYFSDSDNNDITFNATLELPMFHDKHSDINFESYDYDDVWPSDALYNVEPDSSVNQSTHTNCKYYSDRHFACNVKSDSDFSLIHLNARSLNKNFQKIKERLDDIQLYFDKITISETWAEPNTTEYMFLNGYEVCIIARANRKGGGVALFVNHRFNCTLRTAKSFEIENLFECVTIELDMQKHKHIIVSCIYRTPGSDIDRLCEYMDQLLKFRPTRVKPNFLW